MRGPGDERTQQRRTGRRSNGAPQQWRGRRRSSGSDESRTPTHTGVFSTVGAEPRSSWTIPGATVIPNPSVDPGSRSWVDPDAVRGVLGPPQPNLTSHDEVALPHAAHDDPEVAARGVSTPDAGDETGLAPMGRATMAIVAPDSAPATSRVARMDSVFRRGQTGLVDLAHNPRARLVGALVLVVLLVLLVGRIGDLVSPVEVGSAPTSWIDTAPTSWVSDGLGRA